MTLRNDSFYYLIHLGVKTVFRACCAINSGIPRNLSVCGYLEEPSELA